MQHAGFPIGTSINQQLWRNKFNQHEGHNRKFRILIEHEKIHEGYKGERKNTCLAITLLCSRIKPTGYKRSIEYYKFDKNSIVKQYFLIRYKFHIQKYRRNCDYDYLLTWGSTRLLLHNGSPALIIIQLAILTIKSQNKLYQKQTSQSVWQ